MRVRGDSSAYFYAKKQYSFETWDEYDQDKDVSILGFPPDVGLDFACPLFRQNADAKRPGV